MTKPKAVAMISIILVVVLFFAVFTFLPKVRIGNYTYNSPIRLVKKGADLSKGVALNFTYEFDDDDTELQKASQMSTIISVMEARLKNYGIKDAQVISAEESVTVLLPIHSYSDSFYKALSQKGRFTISVKDEDNLATILTDSTHFTDVYVTYNGSSFVVVMKLDYEAKAALSQATVKAEEESVKIYFNMDEAEYTSTTYSKQFYDDALYLSTTSADEAQYLLAVLTTERYPVSMTLSKSWYFTGSAGTDALMWAYIALGAAVLMIAVALIVRYGLSGIAFTISLIAASVVTVLLSTFLYIGEMSLAAVLGIIVALAFYAVFSVLVLERFNYSASTDPEQDMTKRLKAALSKSYERYQKPMILVGLVGLVCAIVMWIAAATPALISFGVTLTYGLIFGVLAMLFMARYIAICFYTINNCPKCNRLSVEDKSAEEVK
jgi:preprotein translocase subunit SecD